LPEAQICVRGKGDETRFLPLAPEAAQLLDHYLRLERPANSSTALFVSLKGPARGARMTPAGLRSLFRHHRQTSGVKIANPHRFGSLTAGLQWDSARPYRGTVRNFLIYLGDNHPAVCSLDQLRRDPHVLGWFTHLRSQTPPLAPAVYINRLTHLRRIFEELAWIAQLPELARLIRREDFPRTPQRLPRALTAQQDQLIQQELLRRNDLPSNTFLLLRHTGMRLGECVDLPYDCFCNIGPDHWAIHVPLGKLKTERMVPVDAFVCQLVHRMRFFRSFYPLPPDGRLLSRPHGKQALIRQLRYCLHEVTVAATTRIVPHQLRHTYASEMIRSGVTLPAVMKLLGHADPKMTMRYVDVTSKD
jgi:site-specific recombinase XerD